ncbi:MAG: hypothetical protein A2X80_14195 [Geobacteraceae bacterium GWB2_52_12]|nr:MAG: hypothetical protein A2X80_14195 [Geobacteraceae bacterium GWB2_52_12]
MNLIPFFLRSRAAALMAAILFIAGCGSSDDKSNVQGTRINPVTLFATIRTTAEQTASDALKDWDWSSFIANFGDLLFRADYSLEMRKITYTSTGAEGTQQTLSGLLILPVSGGSDKPAVPILMYQHATQIYRPESPSQFLKNQDRPGDYPEVMVAAAIAATGYAVAMPDFEGLGDNTNSHNFVHGASLADQVIDMLKASRDIIGGTTSTCTWNNKLFLLGYSEGGYATMAATRELQAGGEFTVTASAPLAGPHDLSGVMRQVILADQQYKAPYFLPFILTSYNHAYASRTNSFSPAFALAPPYATTLPPLLDGTKKSDDISRAMGMSFDPLVLIIPKSVLTEQFIALLADDTSQVVTLLRENDSYRGWTPAVPLRMIHHKDDDLVPFANSQVAFDAFSTAGAKRFVSLQEQDVALIIDSDETVHFSAALPTLIDGWNWLRAQD